MIRYILYALFPLCTLNSSAQSPVAGKPFKSGDWISPVNETDTGSQRPCILFTKAFNCKMPVKTAVLYISALGLDDVRLNGKPISEDLFTPGFTNYAKRIAYRKYNITKQLAKQNKFEITVGEGWYRGIFRSENDRNNYGTQAGLIVSLAIAYTDGSKQIISSNPSWKSSISPVRYAELYNGECYDATRIKTNEKPVSVIDYPKDILYLDTKPAVRRHETFPAEIIQSQPNGPVILDFRQNLAGRVRLNLKGKKGDTLIIEHAEVLDKEGNFYTGNLREAKATNIYVLNGIQNIYEPHFSYHGFRYARLTWIRNGKTINPSTEKWSAQAVALYSDLRKTGSFRCSDPMINRLQKNIEWSLNSNFLEIPTDCPQRSERLGWTGDAQVFASTACFLRDTKSFYSSWLVDLAGEQRLDGSVPLVIPSVGNYKDVGGVAGWGDCATILPWTLYEAYGDKNLLNRYYTSMKAWVDYLVAQSKEGIWQAGGFGDWYAPGPKTYLPLIDQCYWGRATQILVNAARVLGKADDINRYTLMLTNINAAFVRRFVNLDGSLTGNTQTAYVLALAFDMLPVERRAEAAKRLVQLIHDNGHHLATGFLGTPALLKVLTDNGYADVAYTLLNQKTCPSWLYPVTMGATTIWEKWDAIKPDGTVTDASYNHYAYGAVGNWLYEYVAGIRKAAPGYKKILIKPIPGGGLTWAKATYKSKYGLISSAWHIKGNQTIYNIIIPKATAAMVELPGQKTKQVKAGHYRFVIKN